MKSSRLKAHLNAAQGYSELSHAKRLKVGAVLVKEDRIISIGYNGTPSGRNNTCEEPTGEVLTSTIPQPVMRTKPEVVHAEMNAIAFAAKNGVSTNECSMIITDSPCYECAKLMIQSGIKEVYYLREYRIKDGIKFLKECGIHVERIEENN